MMKLSRIFVINLLCLFLMPSCTLKNTLDPEQVIGKWMLKSGQKLEYEYPTPFYNGKFVISEKATLNFYRNGIFAAEEFPGYFFNDMWAGRNITMNGHWSIDATNKSCQIVLNIKNDSENNRIRYIHVCTYKIFLSPIELFFSFDDPDGERVFFTRVSSD